MEKESVKLFDLNAAFKALDEIETPKAEKGIKANRVNLKERFEAKASTDVLVEDYYNVYDHEALEEAQEDRDSEVAKAKLARIEKIVDLDAETADDLLPSYVGKVIIQCPQCMTLFYKNPEDIEHDEENPDVVNINEVCQHCGNINGYTLIGKVDSVNEEEAENFETEETEENEFDLDFGEPTEEVSPEGTGGGFEDELEEGSEDSEELDLEPIDLEPAEESLQREQLNEAVEESLTEDADVDYVEYMHSYCNALEPHMDELKKIEDVEELKKAILDIVNEDPDVNVTEKKNKFVWLIKNKKWSSAANILAYLENAMRKAKSIEVKVDDAGELVKQESLTEDFEGSDSESSEEEEEIDIDETSFGPEEPVIGGEVLTTVEEIKDIALDASKAALAEEEAAEVILPEEEVKEITDAVVEEKLGEEKAEEIEEPVEEVEAEIVAEEPVEEGIGNIAGGGLGAVGGGVDGGAIGGPVGAAIGAGIGGAAGSGIGGAIENKINEAATKTPAEIEAILMDVVSKWDVDEGYTGNPAERTTHLEYTDDDPTDGKAVLPDNIEKQLTEETVDEDADSEFKKLLKSPIWKEFDECAKTPVRESMETVKANLSYYEDRLANAGSGLVAEESLHEEAGEGQPWWITDVDPVEEDLTEDIRSERFLDGEDGHKDGYIVVPLKPGENTPIGEIRFVDKVVKAIELAKNYSKKSNVGVTVVYTAKADADKNNPTVKNRDRFICSFDNGKCLKDKTGEFAKDIQLDAKINPKQKPADGTDGAINDVEEEQPKEAPVEETPKEEPAAEVKEEPKVDGKKLTADEAKAALEKAYPGKDMSVRNALAMLKKAGLVEGLVEDFDEILTEDAIMNKNDSTGRVDNRQVTKNNEPAETLAAPVEAPKQEGLIPDMDFGGVNINLDASGQNNAAGFGGSTPKVEGCESCKGEECEECDEGIITTALGVAGGVALGNAISNKLGEQCDEIEEGLLDQHITKYLNEVYSNVKEYVSDSCKLEENKLVVEGTIVFNSGKAKKTVFEFIEVNADPGNIILEGYNKDLAEGKAFTLKGVLESGRILTTESFEYSYKVNDTLVEGLITR